MWRDLRYAVRGLLRAPVFTIVAVVSLGLAIGANATIFSLIDGMWFRPPGVQDPGSLVHVFSTTQDAQDDAFSFPEYRDLRERTRSLSAVVAIGRRGALLKSPDGAAELLRVNVVSTNFFSALGVRPGAGQLFDPGDERVLEQQPAVVLGYTFWQRHFAGDQSIVGRPILLMRGATPLSVVVRGVLPPTFREIGASSDRDLWLPAQTWIALHGGRELEARGMRWFSVLGRLRPGASASEADAEISVLAKSMAAAYPETNKGRQARVISDLRYRMEDGGVTAAALLGVVALVVLITCVNVANLLIARAAARGREIAIRLAIGASRARLLRQLMVESLLLGGLGASAGVFACAWLIGIVPLVFVPLPGFPMRMVFEVDARVLLFTLAVTFVTTILFGLAPSWLASRVDLAPVFTADAGLVPMQPRQRRFRGVLVASQVAISLVLLCVAAVLTRSFLKTRSANLGFERKPVLSAWLVPFDDVGPETLDDVLGRLRALPGVTGVAAAFRAPLSPNGGGIAQQVRFLDRPEPRSGLPEIKYNEVQPEYFRTLGIRLLAGRLFTERDEVPSTRVVIVSDVFAHQYFPSGDAVGKLLHLGGENAGDYEIVGVVQDVVINDVGERPEPYFYKPYTRTPHGELTLLIGAAHNAGPIAGPMRQALRSVDRRLDPRIVMTMEELADFKSQQYRLTAALIGVLGFIGLLLTAIGVYGVVSYTTTRRARELAVRLALGAEQRDVVRLVVAEGARLTLIGVAIGLPLAMLGTRGLASFLFNSAPWDPVSSATATAVLAVAVGIASLLPAFRIARLDPARALRQG